MPVYPGALNVQIAADLDGRLVAVGMTIVHGARHDAHAYAASGLADLLADIDTVADSGYVGVDGIDLVPYKKPPGRELHESQAAFNTALSPNPGRGRASRRSPEDLAHAQRGRRPLPRASPQIPL